MTSTNAPANNSAVRRRNARPEGGGGAALSFAASSMSAPYATIATPIDISTQRSCPSSTASLTASTIASCTTVATFDSAAPATAAGSVAGSVCARLPMVATTAVLETKPPNKPEMGSPARVPTSRCAT